MEKPKMRWRELWMVSLCPGCEEAPSEEGLFCASCRAELGPLPFSSHCALCMRPNLPNGSCAFCSTTPPAFDSVHTAFVYEGPIARAIHRFKYKARPELASLFAHLWKAELGPTLEKLPDNIVPVPLHRQRYWERGFEQTFLLGKALSKLTGKTLRLHWLKRTQATARQVGHGQDARQQNLDNLTKAFAASPQVQNQAVLLLDDVVTTGSTISACALALKKAGAHSVHILCISRTVFAQTTRIAPHAREKQASQSVALRG